MKTTRLLLWGIVGLTAGLGLGGGVAVADDTDNELVQMIIELVNDPDKDMRAVGLEQIREEVRGPAATQQFAAMLPKLLPEAQAALIDALGTRGDATARPAVLEMLQSSDVEVRAAVLRALGSFGETADVKVLVEAMAASSEAEKKAARRSLRLMPGEIFDMAIAAELRQVAPSIRAKLIAVLLERDATRTVAAIFAVANDDDASVRANVITALGALAGPEYVAGMVKLRLKAKTAPEGQALEKAIVKVCRRAVPDPDRWANPLLVAMAKLDDPDKLTMFSTLGRVGGPAALKTIERLVVAAKPKFRDTGIRALCNWPDASIAPRLMKLAMLAEAREHRIRALRALIRVASLSDDRSDAERLALLKKAMGMATRDEERNLVLSRVRAIRTVEAFRFVVPYLSRPMFAQQACVTVVELAHHRGLREPNKAEFDKALDVVIRTSKDPNIIDRAERYKEGRTLAPTVAE